LTIVVVTDNVRRVPNVVAQTLKQRTPFSTHEQKILLGLRIAAARVVEPWAKFLKATAELSTNQYNVLRILRGSHPAKLACGDIAERMIERDPDITRLVDRLAKRRLVARARSRQDRRVVEVGITEQGLALLRDLDAHVQRLPTALLGHLGPERGRQLAALLEAVIAGIGPFP
jgi:DNA-binding MarR family transcriptional regulator